MRHATNRHTSIAVFEYSYNCTALSEKQRDKNNGIKKIKKRPSNVEHVGSCIRVSDHCRMVVA